MEEKKKIPIGWPKEKALIVAVGPSGAGKTKFFESLDPATHMIVSYKDVCEEVNKKYRKNKIEPTEQAYFDAFVEKVKETLQGDKVVVADHDNMAREQRSALTGVAKEANRPAYAAVFQPDINTLKENFIRKFGEDALTPDKIKELEGFVSMMKGLGPSIATSFGDKVFTIPPDGDPSKVKYAELDPDM